MNLKVTYQFKPQRLKSWAELPEAAKQDFDYVEDKGDARELPRFFIRKGEWYDLHEFTLARDCHHLPPNSLANNISMRFWDGCQTQSAWDAILVKQVGVDADHVIVGYCHW